jgi:hypothetical protein
MLVIAKQEGRDTVYTNRVTGDVAVIAPTKLNHWLIMSARAEISEQPFSCRADAVAAIEAAWA